jgi:hypothetical protein
MKVLLLGIFFALLYAATGNIANASPKNPTCLKTQWTEACFDHTAVGRRIKPQYLKRIRFQRNGFAVLHLKSGETIAVDKKGRVVVPGIVTGNYDFRDAEGGIAMFSIPAKNSTSKFDRYNCGYFQLSNFEIIIPPVYNRCDDFQNQKAYVCTNCRHDCVDCNSVRYYGGEGFVINTKNEILQRITLPKLPLCSTVEGVGGYPENQPCRPESSQPPGN